MHLVKRSVFEVVCCELICHPFSPFQGEHTKIVVSQDIHLSKHSGIMQFACWPAVNIAAGEICVGQMAESRCRYASRLTGIPTNKLHSHLISICVKRSVSFSDRALKKSRPRKLNHTLQHADADVRELSTSKSKLACLPYSCCSQSE